MKFVKFLTVLSGTAALAFASFYVQAGAAEPNDNVQVQTQQRTTARSTGQRRSYRSYSYEPSRGGDVAPRVSARTWTRADSKVKFRYGYYPF